MKFMKSPLTQWFINRLSFPIAKARMNFGALDGGRRAAHREAAGPG